jgi:hypothetical protein
MMPQLLLLVIRSKLTTQFLSIMEDRLNIFTKIFKVKMENIIRSVKNYQQVVNALLV